MKENYQKRNKRFKFLKKVFNMNRKNKINFKLRLKIKNKIYLNLKMKQLSGKNLSKY